ncbi:PTS sugar transporter subunit IIC, partial [Enterococcus faecalis]|uniref:PTS sugar transporter subunit IIC n=2 Tax=Enterococcus TaxID=1350 RepID=UPI003CC60D86
VLDVIPEFVMTGLTIASKIIPAVGLAMLLSMMMKKNMWIFLILGFTLATFLQLPTIAIALFALCAAAVYDIIMNQSSDAQGKSTDSATTVTVAEDDGGYD